MTKGRERKLKLALMIGFAVVSTSSLAVSTFAWFVSRAKATLSTSTMVVDSPDDFDFYAYAGNPDSSYVPEDLKPGEEEGGERYGFDHDFVKLSRDDDAATLNHYLSMNGIYPGRSLTFAFDVQGRSNAKISITKITSNDAVKQGIKGSDKNIQHRYAMKGTTEVEVNVGWAIDIYAMELTSDSVYASFVTDPSNGYTSTDDLFLYDDMSDDTTKHATAYLAGSEDDNHVITLTNPIELYSSDDLTDVKYVLISVLYSDAPSTYFKEVESSSGSAPVIDVVPEKGDRYFRKDSDIGTSNCYSNLTFALNELKFG